MERQTGSNLESQRPNVLSSLYSVLFILSSLLVGFAAFRNTLTWHLQRFWGASGDFWQSQWDKFLDITGEDDFTLWVIGTTALTIFVYWFFGGLYTIMDITNKPAVLRKYKIQPGTNEPVDNKRLMEVIVTVLFNQFVVGIPMSLLAYKIMTFRGIVPNRELPTFHWVLLELAVCILVEEVGFYYSHRFLHSKHIYKFIHKQHHEWTAPISVTAIYCHPIEHIFSNVLPPFLGVLIMGSHVATAWLWFSLAILSTLNAHSGYHLPFFPSPEAHDFHHLKHIMMLSFTPPREAFPDSPKKSM
uniref:Uncharacterized protein n=1 Tax=Phlebotomus papatasi TaxID=29031 RepID=A0A1B0DB15_PHLPP